MPWISAQDAGHNLRTLSERIGHADVTVTERIYTRKSCDTHRQMAQAMGELIELVTTGKRPDADDLGTS